jgi:hypothetical protein
LPPAADRDRSAEAQRLLDERQALADLRAIPQRAVLLLQGDDEGPGTVNPCRAARIVQQHQRQQTEVFRLLPVDFAEHPSEPDGFGAELPADQRLAGGGEIAFVEDQ